MAQDKFVIIYCQDQHKTSQQQYCDLDESGELELNEYLGMHVPF